jgi:sodium/hydrogen antiporter
LLFGDASAVPPAAARRDLPLTGRLLAIGLPLSILAGTAVAVVLFPSLPLALAGVIAASLAPTDAALSASVIGDERLPARVRRVLNVESGLNDGIATPFVTALIAASVAVIGAGVVEDTASATGWDALIDLGGGVLIGGLVGYVGGSVVVRAQAHDWIAPGARRIAVLTLPVLAFLVADKAGVNYFVAAFVAGLGFRAGTGRDDEQATELPELIGSILSLTVWGLFGAVFLLDGLERADWRIAVYAVLSLTVVRMLPVAISMIGAGFSRPATLFIGWFGPRGLASVVFGLLIVEELPVEDPRVQTLLSTIVLTVLLSVIAHGISGRPLTAWMGCQEQPPDATTDEATVPTDSADGLPGT